MLILARKRNQSVFIDVPPSSEPRRIEVVCIELKDGRTRLGFVADEDVVIIRDELDGGKRDASAGVDEAR